MASACMALLQPAPSRPRMLSYSPASSAQRFVSADSVVCSSNGERARAIRRRYFRVERKIDEKVSHGSLLFVSCAPIGRIAVVGGRLERCCAIPRDVGLEETEEDDVGDDLSGVGARTESKDGAGEQIEEGGVVASTSGIFQNFPSRYKLIVTTSLAFVICNMDKVNMSVAIIPMSHQLGWSASTSGLVQSSFFWGYAISQLPGGFLAGRFSGKKVLQAGVLAWSLATALVPVTAPFLPVLLFCRLLVGLGEGVSPAAATDLIARTMPVFERSRAVSVVFGGLNVGSVVGLLLAPVIIRFFGWEVVFYIFGVIGLLWCLGFDSASSEAGGSKLSEQSKQSPRTGKKMSGDSGKALGSTQSSERSDPHAASFNISDKGIPWGAFFKDPAVWAMMYAHFCSNWGHYNLLSWFPTYFSEELNLNLTNSALVSILPPLGSVVVSAIASSLADYLISKDVDITFVRKLCQSIAFTSPAVCMTLVSLRPDLSPWLTAGILTVGSSLSTFTLAARNIGAVPSIALYDSKIEDWFDAGLYCTHQDISPKYASVLLGITNTAGAVPGIVGVALTGYILDQTKSWTLALFVPSIFFYVTGAVVWNVFASSKPKTFRME